MIIVIIYMIYMINVIIYVYIYIYMITIVIWLIYAESFSSKFNVRRKSLNSITKTGFRITFPLCSYVYSTNGAIKGERENLGRLVRHE